MTRLSGAEFNATNTRPLRKLTNEACCHNGFQYREGLNIDPIPLSHRYCSAGGLYVTFEDCWYHWTAYRSNNPSLENSLSTMDYIWDVDIPDDATVIVEDDTKIKATAIILSNRRPIKDLTEWKDPAFRQRAVALYTTSSDYNYRFFPSLTLEQQLRMVENDGYYIQYLAHPSEEAQMYVINMDPWDIKYIQCQSEAVQLEALKMNPAVIRYIRYPTIEAQRYADTYLDHH